MKILFASDLHGSASAAEKVLEWLEKEGADRFFLLGDLLYHGPRNDLPDRYEPREVIRLLNESPIVPLCVRGNCDAEVDQMVLEFPIGADSLALFLGGRMAFVTHGHLFNTANPPKLCPGDLLIHGHTHVQAMDPFGQDNLYLNPGSVSLPKEGNENSYMTYEDGLFTIKAMDGRPIRSTRI